MIKFKLWTKTPSLPDDALDECEGFGTYTGKEKRLYNYWRIRILYSLIFGYAAFYLVRGNFTIAIPALQAEFGYTTTEIGLIPTVFSIIYAIGKFVNGFVSDRFSARYFMSIGLIASACVTFLIGFNTSLLMLAVFWGLSAWFQSMGAPTCARLLAHWFSPKEIGTKWGLWNSSHQIGGAIISILAGYLVVYFGWRYAFFVPSIITVLLGLLLLNRLRDTPQSLGLPPVEDYKRYTHTQEGVPQDAVKLKFFELIKAHILWNRPLWFICIANFFLYIVRIGIATWSPKFLHDVKGSPLTLAGYTYASFEIMGLLGGIAAGYVSDKYFGRRRGIVAALYMLVLVGFLFYFWKIPAGNPLADTLALVGVGFFVYGPQVLGGVAAVDLVAKPAVGAANGLTGTFAYLGGAVAGVGLGYIVDTKGWDAAFENLIAAAFLSAFFFATATSWKPQGSENPS